MMQASRPWRHVHHEPHPSWRNRQPIDRVSGISREEFERRFVTSHGGEGRPVILTDAMERWPLKGKWSLDFFAERHGHLSVRAWCRSSRKKPYAAIGYELLLRDYIEYCRSGDLTQPPPGARPVSEETRLLPEAGTLYWYENLARPEFAPLLEDFDVDLYFIDNLQARLRGEWKRLAFFMPFTNLFIGGPGTCVDLHHDYWSSHTIIAHLEGRKHAILFPPRDGKYLFNTDNEPLDPRNLDPEAYPDFNKATLFEGGLEPGDLLFMPPNWYHDVLGLSATLSLGMNFYSLHNLGEYLPNLLSYPRQLYQALAQHPTLWKELHDEQGMLLSERPGSNTAPPWSEGTRSGRE
jgi:hypothetical protein